MITVEASGDNVGSYVTHVNFLFSIVKLLGNFLMHVSIMAIVFVPSLAWSWTH